MGSQSDKRLQLLIAEEGEEGAAQLDPARLSVEIDKAEVGRVEEVQSSASAQAGFISMRGRMKSTNRVRQTLFEANLIDF